MLTAYKDRYIGIMLIISAMVAVLIHFPELISLFDVYEQSDLFPGMQPQEVAFEVLFTFLSLLFLFIINNRFWGQIDPKSRIPAWRIVVSFAVIWILNSLSGKLFVLLHRHFDIPAIDAMVHHYLHPLRDFIMACVVTGSSYILFLTRRQQLIQLENQQLQAENLLNQYEALKNQLNPHMLFNSLNTLRSLVREDTAKAQEYIQELSRVLRYTLQGNESQAVPLSEEMDFVRAYIFLQKMRYEDNLQFEIRVDKNFSEQVSVPPMAVQLLIENAIKHNEISDRKPLLIRIVTEGDGWLSVCNPIQPKLTDNATTGIGLVNLNKRYELLFKRDIRITQDNGIFCVKIPLM